MTEETKEPIEEYTEQDVIQYIKDNDLYIKSRARKYIDPRNYLINILTYKYNWVEERVAALLKKDRTTINYCKDSAYYTVDVRERFSDWEPDFRERRILIEDFKRKKPVTMQLNKEEYEKIAAYMKILGLNTMGGAARIFIFNHINKVI